MQDDKKVKQIQKLLDTAESNLSSARTLLLEVLGEKKTGKVDHTESARDLSISDEGKVIEGIFDGEQMTAPDGKKYPVPANYASKSKLVEGDTLKLTISEDGGLIYKQIKPIERKNIIGTLTYDNGNYTVLAEGKNYRVLFASVTYYKGEPGSKASVIVPADKESSWAALESIIHEHEETEGEKVEGQSPSEPTKSAEEPKEEKGQVETPEVEQKIDLPEENKEILEEVKESFSQTKEPGADKPEADTTPSETTKKPEPIKPIIRKEEPEISEDMTIKEAAQASASEEQVAQAAADEHPDIKKQGDYIQDEEPAVKEEKETNSLGEEFPGADDEKGQEIKELEI